MIDGVILSLNCRHSWVVNLMRKTTKKELTRPAVTRFATCYLTLRRLREAKVSLKAMFSSEKWQKSPYAKQPDGKAVGEIISDEKFWSSIQYCLKCSLPLVKVLRLVDGDAKAAMGYIYEAMDRAKEQIKKNFKDVKKRYQPIWDIIDLICNRNCIDLFMQLLTTLIQGKLNLYIYYYVSLLC